MNCHELERELGDYVDGTLPPDRITAVEGHVEWCGRCRTALADFDAIRRVARTLEPQMPAAHVWTHLAAAIEQESRIARIAADRRPWWRLASGALAWRSLAAAAVMLLLVSSATWLSWRQTTTHVVSNAAVTGGRNGSPVNPEVQLADQHYAAAIGDLEKVTQAQSGSLDPETAKVVQVNLAMIDQAIGQSRAALQSEPASPAARDSLFDALRSKVQLLQDTVALINEMRKGDPDGAARIMSGTNP
jgi:anti-sigma factor ChrR (cupin superfamily)